MLFRSADYQVALTGITTFEWSGSLVIIRIRGCVRAFLIWSRNTVIFKRAVSPGLRIRLLSDTRNPTVNSCMDEIFNSLRPVFVMLTTSLFFDFPAITTSTFSFDNCMFGANFLSSDVIPSNAGSNTVDTPTRLSAVALSPGLVAR